MVRVDLILHCAVEQLDINAGKAHNQRNHPLIIQVLHADNGSLFKEYSPLF